MTGVRLPPAPCRWYAARRSSDRFPDRSAARADAPGLCIQRQKRVIPLYCAWRVKVSTQNRRAILSGTTEGQWAKELIASQNFEGPITLDKGGGCSILLRINAA
jgi:hypothetical protein